MDELVLFYYYCWLLWLLIYFFLPLSRVRTVMIIWILVFILTSQLHVSIGAVQVSLSFIILLIGTLVLFGLSHDRFYDLMISFICMISYAGLLMWEKTAPVLFFIPSTIIIPFLIAVSILLLIHSFHHRMIVVVIGLSFGQLLYELILMMYSLNDSIGNYFYMNYLLMTILWLLIAECIIRCVKKMICLTRTLLY